MYAIRARRIWCTAVILAGVLSADPCHGLASATDYTRKTKDLTLTVDSRWAGGKNGGYIPIRIRVRNRGPETELLFRFSADSQINLPAVQKQITVGQNATRQFTMSVPMISTPGFGAFGKFTVSQNGRPIQEFTETLTLPENDRNELKCPSLLVVSPKKIDCEHFSHAANSFAYSAVSMWNAGYDINFVEDYEVIEPTMLPDSTVDYSALDVLAISLETFGKLPEETRSAMLNWVQTGGKLILYETGAPVAAAKDLQSLLPFPGTAGWKTSDIRRRHSNNSISQEELDFIENFVDQNGDAGSESVENHSKLKYVWDANSEIFAVHPLMLGHVIAFPQNPFSGSVHDWIWFFNSIKPLKDWRWTARQGISTRQADSSFHEFMIPGVGGVPKVAFLVLITGFTIVIGPLNYFLLRRRRQLFMLVVTIPCIALLTSFSLFAYAAIADGFEVSSRSRSFTLLDQRNKTAVSLDRFALYAGVAPAAGLQFSHETAVYPLQRPGGDPPQGGLDWTNGQQFTNGWIRARTPAQFVTVSQRTERGRVEITPAATSDAIQVANGLEWAIDTIFVIDEQGEIYHGSDLPAGRSAELSRIALLDARQRLAEIYNEHPLKLIGTTTPNIPQPVAPPTTMGSFVFEDRAYAELNYSESLLESRLRQLFKPQTAQEITAQRRTYLAILKQNPGLELGVEQTNAAGDFHVLQGMY